MRKSTQVVSEECGAGTDGTQMSQVNPVDKIVTYGFKYTMRTATSPMSQLLLLLAISQSQMSHVTSSDTMGSQLGNLKISIVLLYAKLLRVTLHRYYVYELGTTTGVDC